jgi:tetratricopeptide (TPR) repeat protein
MALDLGDMTVKLTYFGRAHSTSDIFIHIPEEKILMTGDLFLDQRWVPLFAGQPVLDIDRWLEVMHTVLDGDDAPETVIPGHMDLWEAEKLRLWRDYIRDLWQDVKQAKAEGLSLAEVKKKLPLQEPYYYLRKRGHSEDRILRFHDENIEAFWAQLFESAAAVLEEVIRSRGIEAAVKKLHAMKSEPDKYLINESQLNSLGYKLMGEEKLDEALAIFKCNVELFPESFNVWDSLGEAYMNAGDRKRAIEHYKQSLKLNPQNNNATEMIERIQNNK